MYLIIGTYKQPAAALLCVEFETLSATLRRKHQTVCSPPCYVEVCLSCALLPDLVL